jgi:outer membrane biosynthesis protein TonB
MQEFSSISVSSYEAGSLAERLTEQSRDGWHVAAIVPTGSTVTAYLCRETDGEPTAPAATEPAAVAPAVEPSAEPQPEPEPESEPEPTLAETTTMAAAITPEPASEPAAEPATEPLVSDIAAATEPADTASAAGTTTAAAGAAPAGWYADPSGRFELRYWDGGQWTEHVSRAGQQYTDPPIA